MPDPLPSASAAAAATYAQFCVDVPRLKLVIDGTHDAALSPMCVYTWLINLFDDERTGLQFAYWCTQTALADIYIRKLRSIHALTAHCGGRGGGLRYHLLDDGRQTVEVHSTQGTLRLFKPFRLCQLDTEGTPETVRLYHLHVTLVAPSAADGVCRTTYTVEWELVYEPRWRRLRLSTGTDEADTDTTRKRTCRDAPAYEPWLVVKAPTRSI